MLHNSEAFYKAVKEMQKCNIRVLGGDLLFIRNGNDCLTISRGVLGMPIVDSKDGDFSKIEIEAAKHLYENSEAGRR